MHDLDPLQGILGHQTREQAATIARFGGIGPQLFLLSCYVSLVKYFC